MRTIAIDAMGGDHGVSTIVEGCAQASMRLKSQLILVGNESEIKEALSRHPHRSARIEIVHCEQQIPMDVKPRRALRDYPDASLPRAAALVGRDRAADALISAGNTGAVVLSCAKFFERLEGIRRTALAAVIPTQRTHGSKSDPFSLLLDVGATVDVSSVDLINFASMGAAYASIISQNSKPSVALLSNGSEPNKGRREIIEAHKVLSENKDINFIGNVEGVDLPRGRADVVVCDGFTGNVVLKMLEGVSETAIDLAKYAYRRKLTWRLAFLLLSSGLNQVKDVTDWQQYGGAPILGFDRLCIKAHGRSSPRAIRNAIRVAEKCAEQQLAERIAQFGLQAVNEP